MLLKGLSLLYCMILCSELPTANSASKPLPVSRVMRRCFHDNAFSLIREKIYWLGALVPNLLWMPLPVEASTWQFSNGEVTINEPFKLADKTLRNPQLLGNGGGGAVFSLNENGRNYAVKVSWASSRASIANECRILQYLEEHQVPAVERCRGMEPYGKDTQRVMLLLEPVVEEPIVASVSELKPEHQTAAVESIMDTMVKMIASNVVTADVQNLASGSTGEVLFIDFSEAKILSSEGRLPFVEEALLSNFVQEVIALIPDELGGIMTSAVEKSICTLGDEHQLRMEAMKVLREQGLLP